MSEAKSGRIIAQPRNDAMCHLDPNVCTVNRDGVEAACVTTFVSSLKEGISQRHSAISYRRG
jgi:hypothetical protein